MGGNTRLSVLGVLLASALLVFSGSGGTAELPELLAEGGQRLGETLTLTCLVKDVDNQSKVTWYKDGEPLGEWEGSTIELPALSRNQDGDYTCCLGNGSRCSSKTKQLRVLRGPLLRVDPPGPIRMEEGGRLFLNCVVVDSFPSVPANNFRWQFYPRSGRPDKALNFSQSALTFDPVTKENAGTYECFARNDGGANTGRVSITVQVEESSCIRVTQEIISERDSSVIFTCNVTSDGVRNITWSKDGHVLRHVIGSTSVYVIEKVTCAEAGRYACRSSCGRSEVTSYTSLEVLCPPTQVDAGNFRDHFIVALEGEVNLTFAVYAYPPPVFLWNRPDLTGNITSNVRLDSLVTMTTLRLSNLQKSDFGVYRLKVMNDLGYLNASFNVTVEQVKQASPETGPAESSSNFLWITLVCALAGAYILFLLIYIAYRGIRRMANEDKADPGANEEHHYLGLDRSRQSQEVGDYASGEGSGHYWSIDSADISWQPQAVQPQDSIAEGDETLSRDRASLTSAHDREESNSEEGDCQVRAIDAGGYDSPRCRCDVTFPRDCLCDVTPPPCLCRRDVTELEDDQSDVTTPRDRLLGVLVQSETDDEDIMSPDLDWIPIQICTDAPSRQLSVKDGHCPHCKTHCVPFDDSSDVINPDHDVISQDGDLNVYDVPPKHDVIVGHSDVRGTGAEVETNADYLTPCPYSSWNEKIREPV